MPTAPRRLLVTTAAAVTTSLAVLAPTSAAQAHTWRHTDPAGDVTKYDFGDPDDLVVLPAPQRRVPDVTTWSLRHSVGSVTVRAHFTDLVKGTGGDLDLAGRIRTDTGVVREWQVSAAPGSWRGRRSFYDKHGSRMHCRSSHSIDYTANTFVITMARSCFDRPRWVRGAFYASAVDEVEATATYIDGGLVIGDGDYGKLSSRVHRS